MKKFIRAVWQFVSQEVLDMQASQRHLERIKKGFEEFLNKKRNKITLDQWMTTFSACSTSPSPM